MVFRIIIGALLCVLGFYFVRKPLVFSSLIGQIQMAEKYFGGTTNFMKILGIIIILIGFLAITNLHGQLINWLLKFLG
jgi:hypothetical protein